MSVQVVVLCAGKGTRHRIGAENSSIVAASERGRVRIGRRVRTAFAGRETIRVPRLCTRISRFYHGSRCGCRMKMTLIGGAQEPAQKG